MSRSPFWLRTVASAAILLAAALSQPANAAIFSVNSRDDAGDSHPGNGVCATSAGKCTLRAAIEEANALGGADQIIVPAGFYEIREPALVLSDDVALSGAGAKGTILNARNRSSAVRISGTPVVTISGITIQGGRSGRGAGIDNPDGNLTLQQVQLKYNRANAGEGGALYNNGTARLDEVSIIGNVGRVGGAVYNGPAGQLEIRRSTLRRNRHRIAGFNNVAGGGCLFNAGTATIEMSLFARCQGRIGNGGGGILNQGTASLVNTTMWGCRARLSRGGAIMNEPGATLNIISSTIIRNQAAFVGAGVVNHGDASVRNSILWGNFSRSRDSNCGGSVPLVSLGYNLDGGTACGFSAPGDMSERDPKIGRDADLGGPTRTRALRPGSPAVDTGDADACPTTDQRGALRPLDGTGDGTTRCDIGAFELDNGTALHYLMAQAAVPAPGVEAPEFRANTRTTGHQQAPAVATQPDGHFVVVWQSGPDHDSDGEGLFGQRFDALGHPVGDEFPVNQGTTGDQSTPAIATDADGAFVVVWESQPDAGAAPSIVLRRFSADGIAVGDDVHIDGATERPQSQPSVSVDAAGTATVVWLDDTDEGERVLLRRQAADGTLGTIQVVESGDTVELRGPSVANSGNGNRLVVWSGMRDDVTGVFARHFAADDSPSGDSLTVWSAPSELPDVPSATVATDGSGRAIIVWQIPGEDLDGDRDSIFGQRLNADGTLLGARFRVSRESLGYRAHPRVAASPGGHFLVVWESETENEAASAGITARRFDENGKPLGPEFYVSTRAFTYQVEPNVAVHADGTFQVVWAAEGLDGDGYGVFGHTTAIEGFVGFKVKESPIEGNRLPKHWNVRLDDLVLDDDGGDDPENYRVSRIRSLLNPSRANGEDGDDERPSYLRYSVTPGGQSTQPAFGGKFAKASKHRPRRWEVDNRLGTMVLQSSRTTSVWIPALVDGTPENGDGTPYLCYQVKPLAAEVGSQVVQGKLRRDLQIFAADVFDDCASDAGGTPSFDGTAVRGKCLYHVKKPVELCNPVSLRSADPPRVTTAVVPPLAGEERESLLCYDARPATRVFSADAAFLIGQRGQLKPPQARHARRSLRFGNPIDVLPAADFPAPRAVDSTKTELVCLPTRVRDVMVLK